jgi:hypothetical protein
MIKASRALIGTDVAAAAAAGDEATEAEMSNLGTGAGSVELLAATVFFKAFFGAAAELDPAAAITGSSDTESFATFLVVNAFEPLILDEAVQDAQCDGEDADEQGQTRSGMQEA